MRAYAQRVEELGFTHVLAYDHVAGADLRVHTGWHGPSDVRTTFHEPLVTFGYLAGLTTSLELVTGVIILPQRQAALVAKQATEVDLLSGGGCAWASGSAGRANSKPSARTSEPAQEIRRTNPADAFVVDPAERHLLRNFHQVTGAGLAPLPVQRPIPVDRRIITTAYRRIGRLADGWFPQMQPGPEFDARAKCATRGESRLGETPPTSPWKARSAGHDDGDEVAAALRSWADAGASPM